MNFVEQYLLQLNIAKRRWRRAVAILSSLSLVVALVTVWNLRMTGITIANGAACGYEEHRHTSACLVGGVVACGKEEHLHTTSCYPDLQADVETSLEWQTLFTDYPYTGDLRKDLVGIAKTQVGYEESDLNYQADANGERRGYTRYGAWYGAPYNDWSAMFVSFCLHYAGADLTEFPNSAGAVSMAELWKAKGKYAPAGQYTPISGDLVFFNDNTVGIVTEVQKATIYVISGDVEDTVRGRIVFLTDASITGWGVIDRPTPNLSPLNNTGRPAFVILEGEASSQQVQRYTRRSARAITELIPYLEANGGDFFYTLLDLNNVELPKDANGNYIAQANTPYKLTISFNSPEGFLPGTYQYQIPNGLLVNGGEGSFILQDGTNVGSWVVTDTGLITLDFNEQMNSRTDITVSSTLGILFPDPEEPIDFDGKITVTVQQPPPQMYPTEMWKWGVQGGAPGSSGTDPTKLYWTIQINGHKDSQIPGNILSDQVLDGEWSKDHHYTASDIAGGLTFGVSEPDPVTGEFKDWHTWHVSPDDPRLVWTETGWSYKMPQTITCQWCGEVELGNENWSYTVNYTSTPDPVGNPGTYGYENEASIDGQKAYAWTDFTHGETSGEIVKNGFFVSDAGGGSFYWEFQATIPGRVPGERAAYHWYIMDYMYLLNAEDHMVGYVDNDANLAMVTVTYKGATIQVPCVQDATSSDPFAWDNSWTANNNGVNYGQEFTLLCRCQCTEESCKFWNSGCSSKHWYDRGDGVWVTGDYCLCWAETEDVTFSFVYQTDDLSIVENYGGLGYKLQNVADLFFKPDGSSNASVSSSQAKVPIPGLFKKELTQDFNGYTAHYQVTVNEAKLVLTNGTPLTIRDEMTPTLAYISGSLVVTAEDTNGNVIKLQEGVDYTVTYDGTGNQIDSSGNVVHVLEIVVLRPQPVMYILDYDTTLIMPDHVTGGIRYANSATITLWGETITDESVEKVYADINIAAKSYAVELYKICLHTKKPLANAVFGLYNEQGGRITSATTDADGRLIFQVNITEGVILRDHVLYYMQELRAPPGYLLEDTKHWICFCDKPAGYCATCNELIAQTGALKIPFQEVGKVYVTNRLLDYELPATGGVGTPIYILCGSVLIFGPLVYGFRLRRRHERRSKR